MKDNSNNKINKATYDDKKGYLRGALKNKYSSNEDEGYVWVDDFDEMFVYYTYELYKDGSYKETTYKLSYAITDGVNVSLGEEEPEEVVKESTFTSVSPEADNAIGSVLTKAITDTVRDCLDNLLGKHKSSAIKSFKKDKDGIHRISKFNDEQKISYDPLYAPPDSGDSDEEGMTEDTIKEMVASLNKAIKDKTITPSLFHKVPTKSFEFIEAFVNPWPSCYVGDNEVVKGQPVLVTHYLNDKAWELRKQGVIKGPSIGARCKSKTPVVAVAEGE